MIVSADEKVAVRAAMLAIAASEHMGLGYLHPNAEDNPSEETVRAECLSPRGISIDYYNGRMVKLYLTRTKEGYFDAPKVPANIDYQSWVRTYPTYEHLFAEALSQIKGEQS